MERGKVALKKKILVVEDNEELADGYKPTFISNNLIELIEKL